VVAGLLDGRGYSGARFESLAYFVNVDTREHVLTVPEALDVDYVLHPQHRDAGAADRRPSESARFERSKGRFTIPPRSAVVFVVE
jgi:pullulanase